MFGGDCCSVLSIFLTQMETGSAHIDWLLLNLTSGYRVHFRTNLYLSRIPVTVDTYTTHTQSIHVEAQ